MNVFMNNSKVLMSTRPPIRLMCLSAVGIDVHAKKMPKVDWDIFLRLNKLILIGGLEKSEYIDYFVKFFNACSACVTGKEFEDQIDQLFGGGDEDQSPRKGKPAQDPRKVDTVANNLKDICLANNVHSLDGVLDKEALRLTFESGALDIEIFKQALL